MSSLRTVIERRVNSLGLTEAVVRTEQTTLGEDQHRLVIEIPGVTDLNQAVSLINKTPSLEFKIVRPEGPEKEAIKNAIEEAQKLFGTSTISTSTLNQINPLAFEDPDFISSGLTGQYLKRATVQLGQSRGSVGPSIGIEFNDEALKSSRKLLVPILVSRWPFTLMDRLFLRLRFKRRLQMVKPRSADNLL